MLFNKTNYDNVPLALLTISICCSYVLVYEKLLRRIDLIIYCCTHVPTNKITCYYNLHYPI